MRAEKDYVIYIPNLCHIPYLYLKSYSNHTQRDSTCTVYLNVLYVSLSFHTHQLYSTIYSFLFHFFMLPVLFMFIVSGSMWHAPFHINHTPPISWLFVFVCLCLCLLCQTNACTKLIPANLCHAEIICCIFGLEVIRSVYLSVLHIFFISIA